jgi:hypothetical protein
MTLAARLAELGQLLDEDDRFAFVAKCAIAALGAMRDPEVAALATDERKRDAFYQDIWNASVEAAEPGDDATLHTWWMARVGVVIDYVMRLHEAGGEWRTRVAHIVGAPV